MKQSLVLMMGLLYFFQPLVLAEESQEKSEFGHSQHYVLLAANKTSEMQEQLDEAAAAGYRVVGLWGIDGMRVLLEKTAAGRDKYEYSLLSVTRVPTMQKEINEAAAKGFRLLPNTIANIQTGGFFKNHEGAAIMERPPDVPEYYEYLLLNTKRISTMQKEVRQASEEGYKPVTIVSQCGELTNSHNVYLERPAKTPAESLALPAQESTRNPADRYLVLGFADVESDDVVGAGYRVIAGSTHGCGMDTILEKVTTPPDTYDYVWVLVKPSNLEQKLNEAAARGFRLLPSTLGWWDGKILLAMEKESRPRNFYQYHLLHPPLDRKHTSTLQQELNQASEEGYKVTTLYQWTRSNGGVTLERPSVATSLINLALLYQDQGEYTEAEPLYQRALATRENRLGPEHLSVAPVLENYATLLSKTNREAEAERMETRAQAIRAKHDRWENSIQAGEKAFQEKRYAEAEELYLTALKEAENFGPQEPHLVQTATLLAQLYRKQDKHGEAEPLFQRALAAQEKALGPRHPYLATSLENYADILGKTKRKAEAQEVKARAKAIQATQKRWGKSIEEVWKAIQKERYDEAQKKFLTALKEAESFEPHDPRLARTAMTLTLLAQLYREQGDYGQAEPLFQRALAIREKALGTEDPDVATGLNNLAALYEDQEKYAEAEPLFLRALAIQEKAVGPEHPNVVGSLENYADLLRKTNREDEAAKMEARAEAIRAKQAQ